MNFQDLDQFTQAYVVCALWSTNDNADESGGEPLDSNYGPEDIAPETLAKMAEDCRQFQADQQQELERAGLTPERAGRNFWLNRNGHGSGFWDEYSAATCDDYEREQSLAVQSRDFSKRDQLKQTCGCKYHACQRLSDACRPWGTVDLYVGNDENIHGS